MIFVTADAISQKMPAATPKILLLQSSIKPLSTLNIAVFKNPATAGAQPIKQVIAPNFYVSRLGFFCRQEIKFEKITKIPFRFRLGSVEECDRMEGKYKREN